MVLLGVCHDDRKDDADYLAQKISNLRIFDDRNGRMDLSIKDIQGEVLVISQFTLLADCRKGRRPSYAKAAEPSLAAELYQYFIERLKQTGLPIEEGQFQAKMSLELVNEGPVTLILNSKQDP
jgi:D-tyrosyl-tRNA(Tyr) deacylase